MKTDMTNIPYSPPFMPLNEEMRLVWAVLIGLGYGPVQIMIYEPKKSITFRCNDETKTIDLSWAFKPKVTLDEALELVRRIFKENEL